MAVAKLPELGLAKEKPARGDGRVKSTIASLAIGERNGAILARRLTPTSPPVRPAYEPDRGVLWVFNQPTSLLSRLNPIAVKMGLWRSHPPRGLR
jgi:hypothetical protein